MEKKNYITKEGYESKLRLRKQLSLKASEILEQINENREQEFGDESENAELIRLKSEINSIRTKESNIVEFCSSCVVVDVSTLPQPNGIVRFGTKAEIIDLETEKRKTYQIVGDCEADPKEGTLSYLSPLGSALVGKKIGDIVVIDTPSGEIEYEIVNVSL